MTLTFSDNTSYNSWADYYGNNPIIAEGDEGREQVPLYRGGKNVTPKEKPPVSPSAPDRSMRGEIDNEHRVPLIASAIMDDGGNMRGIAIDHRVDVPEEYKPFLVHHEATELPMMQSYMEADGMNPGEAYAKAHAHATAAESAAVRLHATRAGLDPDQYHDQYKQFFRDAAGVASLPSDRPRHPDAHTTRYALDEHELGSNVIHPEFGKTKEEPHPPLQIDVLGQGTAMHSGPGPFMRPGKYQEGKKPANENKQESDMSAMAKLYKNNRDLFNYYRAMYKQKGGENWERWQDVEEELYFTGEIPLPKGGLKVIEGDKK